MEKQKNLIYSSIKMLSCEIRSQEEKLCKLLTCLFVWALPNQITVYLSFLGDPKC